MQNAGYFGIGIVHGKNAVNVGTLLRTANCYGAAFVFTVGKRYTSQVSDTMNTWKDIPMYNYPTIEELVEYIPKGCRIIGIENKTHRAKKLPDVKAHPLQACYLLGAEDFGLNVPTIELCHDIYEIPDVSACLNVSSAGAIVMYDRSTKPLE